MLQDGTRDIYNFLHNLSHTQELTPCYQKSDIENITNQSLLKLNKIKEIIDNFEELEIDADTNGVAILMYVVGQIKGIIQ